MARLTNTKTGVVVNVDDAKVERLGSDWAAEVKASPRRSKKSDDTESE